ncbi:MAG: 1,4-alpha-glucan branching protein GlgB [Bacillota bacterium]
MSNNQISADAIYLFHQGTNFHSFRMFGAHLRRENNIDGVRFSVWAPLAAAVYLIGEWNDWKHSEDCKLYELDNSGIWTIFKPEFAVDYTYKYEIHTTSGAVLRKADPYAFWSELRPGTASKVANLDGYNWQDSGWFEQQSSKRGQPRPLNIYEVHLGSWKRHPDRNFYLFRELAEKLVDYADNMGYTHIEIMPLAEHPLDESWGYQATGFYSVTSRFGHPQDFMYFVDCCHRRGIGVILDWTPGQFCRDSHGLLQFDGTPVYEYPDAWRADNHEWGIANFDHGKPEVQSFLISNALFWVEMFHIDGLRIDAVSNMLYLSYNKRFGEWTPNTYGGEENLEAIAFLQKLNIVVHGDHPDALIIAEDATMRPQMTAPVYSGGLGFDYKWNLGWMKDLLSYMQYDPIERKNYHNLMTYSLTYAFTENYILPLSHDEVVHGKRSLIARQFGDYWSQFANLRAMFGYMLTIPGKKLQFMGNDIGQFIEWKFYAGLEWDLLQYDQHRQFNDFICDLNHLYKDQRCLWEIETSWDGFRWIDVNDWNGSTFSYMRMAANGEYLLVIINFTPVVRYNFKLETPENTGYWEILNSDAAKYCGSNVTNDQLIQANPHDCKANAWQIEMTLPPLAVVILKNTEKR